MKEQKFVTFLFTSILFLNIFQGLQITSSTTFFTFFTLCGITHYYFCINRCKNEQFLKNTTI